MEYFIKDETWMLNPNEKVVKGITKGVERNNGHCPCHNTGEDTLCPCSNYRLHDHCCCNLYVKKPIEEIINEVLTSENILDGGNLITMGEDITTIA
jgi:hypothetical protein